jgi:spermidine/putrescine ABC transporter ATP-binding subunit
MSPLTDAPAASAPSQGAGLKPAVELRGIVRRFDDTVAVAGVSLDFAAGSFISILGPSGCGKTTLLRIIAGIERQDEGTISIGGAEVGRMPAHRRPVNLVFQRYALFPHKSVAQNIAFALELERTPRDVVATRVREMLDLVRLEGYGDRTIDQLSGGQAQRVALARALVTEPSVLLLDEPLTALDLKLRQAMQVELREIQKRVGSTFIYVTHDQTEAMVMSDTVVLMNEGRIVQQGTPRDVYEQPATRFSANFLGEANMLPVTVGSSRREVSCEGTVIRLATDVPDGIAEGWVCLRPEHVKIAAIDDGDERSGVEGRVTAATFIGSAVRYTVATGTHEFRVEAPTQRGIRPLLPGDDVLLAWSDGAPAFVPDEGKVPESSA